MRLPRSWLRSRPLVALVALGLAAAVVTCTLWPFERVTPANFRRIQVGMAQAKLCGLLGTPEYQTGELGLVEGPETYTLNFDQSEDERRRRGFQDYRRQQWSSPEITIIVISDADGRVVCRYRGEGRSRDWLKFLRTWVSRLF